MRVQTWQDGMVTDLPKRPGDLEVPGPAGRSDPGGPDSPGLSGRSGGGAPQGRKVLLRSRRLRTAAVGTGAVLVAGGGAAAFLPGLAGASSPPSLPHMSARSLLAHVAKARVSHLSGTVVTQSGLGLPTSISSLLGSGAATGGQAPAAGSSLLSGSTTERFWIGGPGLLRVAVLGQGSEKDLVVSHRTAWLWDSASQSAVRIQPRPGFVSKVRAMSRRHSSAMAEPGAGSERALGPSAAAGRLLASVAPSTVVDVGPATWVAGRAAYQLTIQPRVASSLVSEAVVQVDARTWIPLGVKVFAKGQSAPALSVSYSRISFARPNPSYFRFVPPPGAKVTHSVVPKAGTRAALWSGKSPAVSPAAGAAHHLPTFGSGWGTVVELPSSATSGSQARSLLASAPVVTGTWGSGRLVSSSLVDALVLPSGQVLAGAVSPAALESVASRLG